MKESGCFLIMMKTMRKNKQTNKSSVFHRAGEATVTRKIKNVFY